MREDLIPLANTRNYPNRSRTLRLLEKKVVEFDIVERASDITMNR
jgi:hypothetical protein